MQFLKKIRDSKGLSLYGMALELGLIPQTYIQLETRGKGLQLKTLVIIKRRLDLSWEQLGKLIEKEVETNDSKKTLGKKQKK